MTALPSHTCLGSVVSYGVHRLWFGGRRLGSGQWSGRPGVCVGGFQPVLGLGQGGPPCTCAWGCLRSCLVWGKAGNSASTSLEGHFYLNEKKMVPLCSRSQRQGPGLGRAGRPVRSRSGQAPRAVDGLDARAGRPRRDVRAAWSCLPLQVLIPQLNASGRGQEEGSASRSGSLMACEECLCGGNRFPFLLLSEAPSRCGSSGPHCLDSGVACCSA